MKIKHNGTYNVAINIWSLSLIFIANICFYTENTIPQYIVISTLGIIPIYFDYLKKNRSVIKVDSFIKWVTALYAMYMLYGCFFLRGGYFNWDMIVFTYVSNLALYFAFTNILNDDNWIEVLIKPVSLAVIVATILIITNDFSSALINENETRLGTTLSGNVNTVAVYLGIMSMFISYFYAKKKKKYALCLLLICFFFMLLTGSKKAILIIICDLIIYLKISKEKATAFLMFALTIVCGSILIIQVPLLYNIIGHRIQDFFYQIFGLGKASYSSASDMSSVVRLDLITEALEIYFGNPLYYLTGGGANFFAYNSHYQNMNYYSHSNYTEMLCTYGLLGTSLFYVPLMKNYRKIKKNSKDKDLISLSAILLGYILISSFFMVVFSDTCIVYIPMIFLFAVIKAKYKRYKNV